MSDRSFTFLGRQKAAVAMDEQDAGASGQLITLALAFCNHRDGFSKKIARKILNGRIDHRLSGSETHLTYQTVYRGTTPRKDVMFPVLDAVRAALTEPEPPRFGPTPKYERNHGDIVNAITSAIAAIPSATVASTATA